MLSDVKQAHRPLVAGPDRIWLSIVLLASMLALLAGCVTHAPDPIPEFTSFDTFIDALETAASGTRAGTDAFWNALVTGRQIPFALGDQVAFLYRGRAGPVSWVGDFNDWQQGAALAGRQLGQSGIWLARATFPTNARLEYRIIIDGGDAVLDPANPVQQWGGFGPNSVLAMPDYVFPVEVIPRTEVTAGKLSSPVAFPSKRLGYPVNYQVYMPAGYAGLADLPSIYITDAHEYGDSRMGSLPTVLDNLIADRAIEPALAVFIDPRDPQTGRNRRQEELLGNPQYAAFVAEELVPFIDSTYRTKPSADRRAILGSSYGGVFAAYCGLMHPEVFHLVAMQSPAFVDDSIYAGYRSAERLPLTIFLSTGYPWDFDARPMKAILEDKHYPLKYVEVPEGHSWGQWRSQLDDLLRFFFGGG